MSAYDRVVEALEGRVKVWRRGDHARAQCPAHESRGLTLSVRTTTTRDGAGRVSLHCFASCEDTAILDAIGLKVADLFDEARATREYVPLKIQRPTYEIGGRTWDRDVLANHLANRSAAEELKNTLGADLLAISDPDALAGLYLGGSAGDCD